MDKMPYYYGLYLSSTYRYLVFVVATIVEQLPLPADELSFGMTRRNIRLAR